ncbi:MAG: sulfite exporter TauE/SafE family protein [Acidobacteria bacterium]|nr:sulfite exporter TauE/SafE family protein [Acidobacteriota bacterium]
MEFIVIPLVGFVVSGLTLFSGFGLGTLLLPAFIAFFPAEVAVGMTAVVHTLNNLFKFFLVKRNIDRAVVARFGVPALVSAYFGARLLASLSESQSTIRYKPASWSFATTPLNVVMAVLIVVFAVMEITPALQRLSIHRKYLPLGGILSGFFGGLSGHQGAFRSVFLLRSGLSKDAFIASGIAIALLVDSVRISVYGVHLSRTTLEDNLVLLLVVIAAAFMGAFLGNRFAQKTTLKAVQIIVSTLLFLVAAGLLTGLLGS